MYEEIVYYSDGLKIASHLYAPKGWREGDPPRPAIICLHGYSGMKDVYGMDVPRRLWEEGYFILAPDHRGFGKSEGERGRQRPLEQAQDTYDAISYMETVEGVDSERFGIFGTSFGGANAIWVAAFDERVKVLVSSVGVHEGERWMRSVRRPHEWDSFHKRVMAGRQKARHHRRADHDAAARDHDLRPPHAEGHPGEPSKTRRLREGLRLAKRRGLLAL